MDVLVAIVGDEHDGARGANAVHRRPLAGERPGSSLDRDRLARVEPLTEMSWMRRVAITGILAPTACGPSHFRWVSQHHKDQEIS